MGGRGASFGATIGEIKTLQRAVSSARRAESKAERDYLSAGGSVRMTPPGMTELRNERIKKESRAYNNFVDKKQARIEAEKRLENFAAKYRKRNSGGNVPLF